MTLFGKQIWREISNRGGSERDQRSMQLQPAGSAWIVDVSGGCGQQSHVRSPPNRATLFHNDWAGKETVLTHYLEEGKGGFKE